MTAARIAVLGVAGALLAGCAIVPTSHIAKRPASSAPTKTKTQAARAVRAARVAVIDGDTGARIRGAVVVVARRSARTNRRGVAWFSVPRSAQVRTVARKPGYTTRAVRVALGRRRIYFFRLYRRALQWPLYGARAQRTQAQLAIRVRPPFHVVWSRGLGTLVEFPAVVSDGVAYVSNSRGTVRAFDMRDGTVLWRRETPHGKMAASPAVWRDELVVHCMDGHVWVRRRADGRLLWHYTTGSPIESSPVVVNGLDLFGDWDGVITALDLRTHRVRWRRYDGCKITSSIAVAGGRAYLGDYCGRVLALRVRDGAVSWTGGVNGRVYGTPAVGGGRIFVPSSDGDSLTAFSTGGRMLWRRYFGSYVYSSPAVWAGRVYVGSYNGVFYGLSAASGATRWSVGTGGPISGAAVVVDGIAYAGSFSHRIVGVYARTGRVAVVFPHGEYVPVSGGGRRLLLHGYSRIYAVEHARS